MRFLGFNVIAFFVSCNVRPVVAPRELPTEWILVVIATDLHTHADE